MLARQDWLTSAFSIGWSIIEPASKGVQGTRLVTLWVSQLSRPGRVPDPERGELAQRAPVPWRAVLP